MTKSSNNDQQSRLLYIYKHFCLCVSSVVEITKLYLFIYVPVFWLSIIFIHSNFPPLNILSRWTLKSYFHGECQQAQLSPNVTKMKIFIWGRKRDGIDGRWPDRSIDLSRARTCRECRPQRLSIYLWHHGDGYGSLHWWFLGSSCSQTSKGCVRLSDTCCSVGF